MYSKTLLVAATLFLWSSNSVANPTPVPICELSGSNPVKYVCVLFQGFGDQQISSAVWNGVGVTISPVPGGGDIEKRVDCNIEYGASLSAYADYTDGSFGQATISLNCAGNNPGSPTVTPGCVTTSSSGCDFGRLTP